MKRKRPNENFSIFDEILQSTPEEDKVYISRSMEIANQIITILERRKMLQKQLAELLGKKEPEICKWLSGSHNFTLKTISKIEFKLGERVVTTPQLAKAEFQHEILQECKKVLVKWHSGFVIPRMTSKAALALKGMTQEKPRTPEKLYKAKVINFAEFKKAGIESPTDALRPTGS